MSLLTQKKEDGFTQTTSWGTLKLELFSFLPVDFSQLSNFCLWPTSIEKLKGRKKKQPAALQKVKM